MTGNSLLSLQLKRLLGGLSGHGTQHLAEVETDLAQTSILLGEAIEKLSASFMAIHQAVSVQQEAVDLLLSGAAPTPEVVESIRARRDEIGQHVNAAVTGLQFQDMTSQLISRMAQRATGLRELLATAGESNANMSAEGEVADVAAALDRINAALEEQSARLESTLRKAVCQTHMESGDIELF